jgi:hypothetical protein
MRIFDRRMMLPNILTELALMTLAVFALCVPAGASATAVYVGQSAAGAGDGSSCANQTAAGFFNAGANWGSATTQIGPGTTVHLCGTIATALVAQASGSSTNPITIQWESGTSLAVCNSVGALQLSGRSYFVVDLGGNSAAITCPSNGSGLSSTVQAIGIGTGGSSLTHTEIRNGTIGPLYVYTCCGSDGLGSVAISVFGATNDHVHDLVLNNANEGISLLLGNGITSSGNEINNNNCARTVGRCIDYSNGDGGAVTDTGGQIHNNDITFGDGWFSGAGDYTHLESIRTFNYGAAGSQDKIVGELIYNNYLHGTVSGDATSFIFVPEGLSSCSPNSSLSASIFNNLMVMTGGSGPGDGFIFTQDCEHTLQIYNNTMDGGNNAVGICMEFEGANTVTVENNICENVMTMIYNANAGPTLTANDNDYYNVGTSGANGWYWQGKEYTTLAAWKSATGQDANSISTNPGLNSNYTIPSTSPAAGIGVNLTNLNSLLLDDSKPVNVGPGFDSQAATLRLSTGNWDLGAYASGAASQAPAAPTGLVVVSQN